jgi:hypothetical protein
MSTRIISWGVKAASALCWQPYHLHVPTVLKSGSLNLLEPSGPVQACNGIAELFLTLHQPWTVFGGLLACKCVHPEVTSILSVCICFVRRVLNRNVRVT